VLFGLLLTSSCRRKAPGPEQCRRLALALHGVRSERELQRSARMRAEVDDITRECLVTPYDHEMFRCLEEGARFRNCRARLVQRSAER
jgi:hypothetical protein